MNSLHKILYVDDELSNLLLLSVVFDGEYEVIKADSGHKALEIIKQRDDLDAVICDMKMPIMNGLELIEKAKELNPNIPYFILSGFELSSAIAQALEEGRVYGYFHKPFNKIEIASELEKYFSER